MQRALRTLELARVATRAHLKKRLELGDGGEWPRRLLAARQQIVWPDLLVCDPALKFSQGCVHEFTARARAHDPTLGRGGFAFARKNLELKPAVRALDGRAPLGNQGIIEFILGATTGTANVHIDRGEGAENLACSCICHSNLWPRSPQPMLVLGMLLATFQPAPEPMAHGHVRAADLKCTYGGDGFMKRPVMTAVFLVAIAGLAGCPIYDHEDDGCYRDSDCARDYICNFNGDCVRPANDTCSRPSDCDSTSTCSPSGVCVAGDCTFSHGCVSGYFCDSSSGIWQCVANGSVTGAAGSTGESGAGGEGGQISSSQGGAAGQSVISAGAAGELSSNGGAAGSN